MAKPKDQSVSAWISLISTTRDLLDDVEQKLKSNGLPPLSWYDALLEIERAGVDGLRPYQLTEKLLLPQYGTSRLIERIVKAGLLAREACPDDGRGQRIVVTDEGRKMRRKMWPVYAAFLETMIEKPLGDGDTRHLTALLEKLRPTGS
jgi:DNA-binding MarR family transcriptional regulator